jgi:hypothetical protein
MFIDEAIASYRDLPAAGVVATLTGTSAPSRVLALVDGLDLDKSPLSAWAHFAKGLVQAWASQPLEDVTGELGLAYAKANAAGDSALSLHILRSTRSLLPLLNSNLQVQALEGRTQKPLRPAFDPGADLDPGQLYAPYDYLRSLSRSLGRVTRAREQSELDRASAHLEATAKWTPGSAYFLYELDVFDHLHLADQGSAFRGPALLHVGELETRAGRELAREGQIPLAKDRARMAESIGQVLESEGEKDGARRLRLGAATLRRSLRH